MNPPTIPDLTAAILPLENSYLQLPDSLYVRTVPTPVRGPSLLRYNHDLAAELGLDTPPLIHPSSVEIFAGNRIPAGAQPIALAYAGHQFGHFVPLLGDGRAVLLGEVVDRNGVRRDIQLKGAGRTPFSRNGDGRAALGPVLREYILGEAMHGLGIPTTRALAMVTSGEGVHREQLEPGAILTRVASSHIRVGTFEYLGQRGNRHDLRALADYVIQRHYPQCAACQAPYPALLTALAQRQGTLIAQWLLVGFIHGVMNTDNMAISGETIDYGPCAFMDAFNPGQVYSAIDRYGRYAYDQQPDIGYWNLNQLANSLLPLLAETIPAAREVAQQALDAYQQTFVATWESGLCAKIGLGREEQRPEDKTLALNFLKCLDRGQADFTNSFRQLSEVDFTSPLLDEPLRQQFSDPALFDTWAKEWRARLAQAPLSAPLRRQQMRGVNPAYIPRNHRVQQTIEAVQAGNLLPLDELLTVVSRPYADHPELAAYRKGPTPAEQVLRTFCGT